MRSKRPRRAPAESRVLVVSSSEFLTNPFAYAGNGPDLGGQFQMFGAVGGDPQLLMFAQPYTKYLTSTILSFKNTLDWMAGDSDLVAASAKLIGDPALTYSNISKPKFKAGDDPAEAKRKDEEYRGARKSMQTNVQWTLTFGVPLHVRGLRALALASTSVTARSAEDLSETREAPMALSTENKLVHLARCASPSSAARCSCKARKRRKRPPRTP